MKFGCLECCKGCSNNNGGECDYDLFMESEKQRCNIEDLVDGHYCSYSKYYSENKDRD